MYGNLRPHIPSQVSFLNKNLEMHKNIPQNKLGVHVYRFHQVNIFAFLIITLHLCCVPFMPYGLLDLQVLQLKISCPQRLAINGSVFVVIRISDNTGGHVKSACPL